MYIIVCGLDLTRTNLQVIWKRLYKTNSSNCRHIISSPENEVNSCEEFLALIMKAHILTAAMEVLGMSDFNEQPGECIVPLGLTGSSQSAVIIESVAEVIMSDFVDLGVIL